MRQVPLSHAACAVASLLGLPTAARADGHRIAGEHEFVPTLTFDEPDVDDAINLPTFNWKPPTINRSGETTYEYNLNFSWSERITERFEIALGSGLRVLRTRNEGTRFGRQNLALTAKYELYENAPHEFVISAGVVREFGGTGSQSVGADRYGFTQPTVYVGKGMGDLPVGWLRPVVITGELGFSAADVALKQKPDGSFNNGFANRWVGAMSIQYSLPYLQSRAKDLALPGWLSRMTPLVEISWSSPTQRPNNQPMELQFAPGIVYSGDGWQIGVEALIPGNSNTGRNVGVIAQFHLFLDDLFPHSIGRPVVNWFR